MRYFQVYFILEIVQAITAVELGQPEVQPGFGIGLLPGSMIDIFLLEAFYERGLAFLLVPLLVSPCVLKIVH